MEFQHINVKLFVEGDLAVDPSRFINVFHEWIQTRAMPELLIDVADYCHVPAGPGVLLIGHEADYSMDNTGNRWGLRYHRKMPMDGTNVERMKQAFSSAAAAAGKLESHFAENGAPIRFSRTEFEMFVNDRALAPNTPETLAVFRREVESFASSTLNQSPSTIVFPTDGRKRVGATLTFSNPLDWK